MWSKTLYKFLSHKKLTFEEIQRLNRVGLLERVLFPNTDFQQKVLIFNWTALLKTNQMNTNYYGKTKLSFWSVGCVGWSMFWFDDGLKDIVRCLDCIQWRMCALFTLILSIPILNYQYEKAPEILTRFESQTLNIITWSGFPCQALYTVNYNGSSYLIN